MADFDAFGDFQDTVSARRDVSRLSIAQITDHVDCKIPVHIGVHQVRIRLVGADDEISHVRDRLVRENPDALQADRPGIPYRGSGQRLNLLGSR